MKTVFRKVCLISIAVLLILCFCCPSFAQEHDYEEVGIVWTSTDFNGGYLERTTNIKLAVAAINGTVLNNGEEFSFNRVVGQRTKSKGYKEADVFVNSGGKTKVVKGIGGGICQVSSILHKAARATRMNITERYAHSKPVTYCSRQDEATVSWGTLDFKFINNSGDPIRIEMKVINDSKGIPYRLVCVLWQRVPK